MIRPAADRAEAILDYWFGALASDVDFPLRRAKRWFGGGPAMDTDITERFASDLDAASAGRLDAWTDWPRGALALIILFDQFSRHIHRGSPRAFENDTRALGVCLRGLERGADQALRPVERPFFYMPLVHAEDLVLQERALECFDRLVDAAPAVLQRTLGVFRTYAARHGTIIQRFGRFPHRNQVLDRISIPAEVEFLRSATDAR